MSFKQNPVNAARLTDTEAEQRCAKRLSIMMTVLLQVKSLQRKYVTVTYITKDTLSHIAALYMGAQSVHTKFSRLISLPILEGLIS